MNICVVGVGYVGLVSGTCFAELGNKVICVDNDEQKIESLLGGITPIFEPGLDELVKRNKSAGDSLISSVLGLKVSPNIPNRLFSRSPKTFSILPTIRLC